jgi:membrane fusion protein (multidrug efflux system)
MAARSGAGTAAAHLGMTIDDLLARRWLALLMGGVVLAACAWAAPKVWYAATHETTDDAYIDGLPSVLSAQVPGVLVSVPVTVGRLVKRGTVIARLDDTDAQIAVARAQENLAQARAQLVQAQYELDLAAYHHSALTMRTHALQSQSEENTQAMRILAQSERASVAAADESIAQAQASVTASGVSVTSAQIRYTVAEHAFSRFADLERQGLVPLAQYEASEEEAAQSKAALAQAEASQAQAGEELRAARAKVLALQLESAQARAAAQAQSFQIALARSDELDNSPENVEVKRAAVQSAQAQLQIALDQVRAAQHALGETQLRAPVDGYIAARPASVGQMVNAGDPVIVMMPSGGLYVTANFKETQVDRIALGAPADMHVDSYPGVRFFGHVTALGAASQSAMSIVPDSQVSGNFVKVVQRVPVRVRIDRIDGSLHEPLRAGMSAEVSVAH